MFVFVLKDYVDWNVFIGSRERVSRPEETENKRVGMIMGVTNWRRLENVIKGSCRGVVLG